MPVRNLRVGALAAAAFAIAAAALSGCSSQDAVRPADSTASSEHDGWIAPGGRVPDNRQPHVGPSLDGVSATPGVVAGGDDIALGATTDTSNTNTPPAERPSEPCAAFDSVSATLGLLTADCRGKVDPRDYLIGVDGSLTPAFDSCPVDATLMSQIRQLLSLQQVKPALLPRAKECIAGRFQRLAAEFAASGINECPTWSNKRPINPLSFEKFSALPWPRLSQLPDELPNPAQPATGNDDLEEKFLYSVALPAGITQKCGTPTECAAACAGVFPGFVIPSVVSPTSADFPRTISVDPPSWWSQRTFANGASDPYLAIDTAYHGMSYAYPPEQFGAVQRYWPCGAASTDPTCKPENCSYWAGTHIRRRLQLYCNDYRNPDTCSSYCGPDLPPH
jgi:hypothetical protein